MYIKSQSRAEASSIQERA